ncbi:MAG: class I SAM-dependent DNA methyltransferase, partial [Deltaproteobacteria bacterium]|nr:class I SAM-dependent DNA methyltransferase [Deltaproteobacteria bacterium]
NCLTRQYDDLLKAASADYFVDQTWSKADPRLISDRLSYRPLAWNWHFPLRTDYERRQALIEIDVLTAQALGLTLDDLKTIYRLQFYVLNQNEANTWYDQRGRIIYTVSRGLFDFSFCKKDWEEIKNKTSGTVERTMIDQSRPEGPLERTLEYLAPFDRPDRELDYELAWTYFEKKFGQK